MFYKSLTKSLQNRKKRPKNGGVPPKITLVILWKHSNRYSKLCRRRHGEESI
ncbi:hypothetical protein Hdeb2414_s0009g00302021 [Helianthus debilis subsp. tardiflorus]